MTSMNSVDHAQPKEAQRLSQHGPGTRRARVVMLSLSLLAAHCGGSNDASSSDGVGGAITPTSPTDSATTSDSTTNPGSANVDPRTPGSMGVSPGPDNQAATSESTSATPAAASDGAGGAPASDPSGTTSSGAGGAAANGTSTGNGGGGDASAGGDAAAGGTDDGGGSPGGGANTPSGGGAFTVTSPGWMDMEGCDPDAKTSCAPVPSGITRSGGGTSPELQWSGAPEGTQSFVVLLQDLSNGTAHWILWNIGPTVTMLAANVDQSTATPASPAGSQQCGKGADSDGFYGPGAPCNVYELVLYALAIPEFSPMDDSDAESVRMQLEALGGDILATATLRGRTDSGC